jgi:hypothetical protein
VGSHHIAGKRDGPFFHGLAGGSALAQMLERFIAAVRGCLWYLHLIVLPFSRSEIFVVCQQIAKQLILHSILQGIKLSLGFMSLPLYKYRILYGRKLRFVVKSTVNYSISKSLAALLPAEAVRLGRPVEPTRPVLLSARGASSPRIGCQGWQEHHHIIQKNIGT